METVAQTMRNMGIDNLYKLSDMDFAELVRKRNSLRLKTVPAGKVATRKIERVILRSLEIGEVFNCVHSTTVQINKDQQTLKKKWGIIISYRQTTDGIKVTRTA